MYGRRKTSKTGRAGSREDERSQNRARARARSIDSLERASSREIEGGYQRERRGGRDACIFGAHASGIARSAPTRRL